MSALFRSIELDLGTHGFCILVLESFVMALRQYRIKTKKELFHQFNEIFELIQGVKPKYAILIDSFYKIFTQAEGQSVEGIIENINQIKKAYQDEMLHLVEAGLSIDVHGKSILIYDHSHSVQNVLEGLRSKGQKFSVILAEQDIQKTEDNIAFLHQAKIPFKVIPAYMISHFEEEIDMAFFGAVTFQDGGKFVMDPGSKSIISHLNLERKPVYLFLTTSKFSLWKAKDAKSGVHVKTDIRCHQTLNQIEFERVKFSHDRVSVKLVDHIVTEQGVFDGAGLLDVFGRLLVQRERQEKHLDEKVQFKLG